MTTKNQGLWTALVCAGLGLGAGYEDVGVCALPA